MIRLLSFFFVTPIIIASCTTDETTSTCTPDTVNEDVARQLVATLCEQRVMLCTFQQDTRIAWSAGSEVFVSPVRCADDVQLCLFAVWHEFGHVKLGQDEARADCYAAEHAKPEQVDAAICYFDSVIATDDTGTHGTPEERVARILACRPPL